MRELNSGEVWASLDQTQPIPLWDVEGGRFLPETDPEPPALPDDSYSHTDTQDSPNDNNYERRLGNVRLWLARLIKLA